MKPDTYEWSLIRLFAYVILVVAVIFAISSSEFHYNAQREALQTATQSVLAQQCQRGNDLRKSLQHILIGYEVNVQKQEKAGVVTKAEAEQFARQINDNVRSIAPIDCHTSTNLSKR